MGRASPRALSGVPAGSSQAWNTSGPAHVTDALRSRVDYVQVNVGQKLKTKKMETCHFAPVVLREESTRQ